jgi:hypothetical protein
MKFEFSGSLLRYVGYARTCSCEAANIGDAFAHLREKYPQLNTILFASDGRLSKAHQLFINGVRVPPDKLSGPDFAKTPLAQSDAVSILTLITGG